MTIHEQPPPLPSGSLALPLQKIIAELKLSRRRARSANGRSTYARDLPNPEVAAEVLKDIFAALFPRHGGGQDGTDEGIDYFVGYTLNRALRNLRGLLSQELRFTYAQEQRDYSAIDGDVASILRDFSEGLPDVRESVLLDAQAAFDGDPSAQSLEEILLSYPGIRAVYHHRIAHSLFRLGAPVLSRIISEISHSTTGIDIHPGAQIGPRFFIDHGTGVVIGETTVIGARVRIYQAVTLGAKRFSVDESGSLVKGTPRHPIVEDDVVIYAGATILGRITIGRGSIIGGNVWLTRSVPAGSHILQAQPTADAFESGSGI
jgi:serine O-acetyltransferase